MGKMKHRTLWPLVFGIAIAGYCAVPAFLAAFQVAAEPIPLCVMTFNLRYASPKPPHSWPERRPVMRNLIKKYAPDLIGTQEGLYPQLKDLAEDLPEYNWIGLGREGGSRGEFMAVFYRRERFDPVAYDHFWLSDTPEVIGSSTWGNTNRRMVTWVRFREGRTSREFFFWNTHLDNDVEMARQKGAALIVERAQKMQTDLPLLLVGDFNSTAGNSRAYEILVQDGGFADLWLLAREHVNERLNSFHGYNKPVEQGVRIDWILSRGSMTVDKAEIINYSENGGTPSDHFPVAAWVTMK
jgi:endonuclease/exonuclease/phosphatase family metal-dependent hydrolase